MSPVEHALASQPAGQQHRHIVVTMAQYIYHRHDPRLPTIATLLLKRLAVVSYDAEKKKNQKPQFYMNIFLGHCVSGVKKKKILLKVC